VLHGPTPFCFAGIWALSSIADADEPVQNDGKNRRGTVRDLKNPKKTGIFKQKAVPHRTERRCSAGAEFHSGLK
jgi:hypothetical protein